MIPSVVSSELEQAAKDSIRTAFHPTTSGFEGLIERFLNERDRFLKGPYISVALPFRKGSGRDWFPQIPLEFPPYRHQDKAFARLLPGSPQNTLVATGTGSGKTECFLLPVLDHCRQALAEGQQGIKAILIYPMNALATDQAKRIAQLVHQTPALRGIRAGLYIGGLEDDASLAMGPEQIITDRRSLEIAPPDILLTNYKQLDYLLMQPKVQQLWQHNTPQADGSSPLRYLVVDEFHSFDGAQGTDLACLIRRLRDRLHCRGDRLICVGTSATLGGPESASEMRGYAEKIFASRFDADALIEEERLNTDEFLRDCTAYGDTTSADGGLYALAIPGPDQESALDPRSAESPEAYLHTQAQLWLGDTLAAPPADDVNAESWRLQLGWRLGSLPAIHNLLRQAERVCSQTELLQRFSRQLGLGEQFSQRYRVLLLSSLLALASHAQRTIAKSDGETVVVPWIALRQQLWLRELKRMVASVETTPTLQHSDDLSGNDSTVHWPVVHCRDCGATGWASTLVQTGSNSLDRANDLPAFYKAFFSGDQNVRYLFHQTDGSGDHQLCPDCLSVHPIQTKDGKPQLHDKCPACHHPNLLRVDMPDCLELDEHNHHKSSRNCPYCHAHRGLLLIGSTAANLTSTWSATLFASAFNGDKKLLTFSDSVQDAAHRAGFIGARSYRTTLRTAITQTVQEQGPLSLDALQAALIKTWEERLPNPVDFAATFIPPDLEWMPEWDQLQQQDTPQLPENSDLIRTIHRRLLWEVASELGYRSRLGATLEQSGSIAASVDPTLLNGLLPGLLAELQNEVEPLRHISEQQLQQMLLGLLCHWRQRGALDLPELTGSDRDGRNHSYLQSGGKNTDAFFRIRHLPKLGRYSSRPIFPIQSKGAGLFEQLVRRKGESWAQQWIRKTLQPSAALEVEQAANALGIIIRTLVEADCLIELSAGNSTGWAIRRTAIQVSHEASHLRCSCCGDRQSVLSPQSNLWEGMPCLVRHCSGHYSRVEQGGLPLYQHLYGNGDVQRIVAREHTGLLPRVDRERIEKQFINHASCRDTNLLSATSTLEMGINIGDLSTVLLASVPPEPSNYLQRIGRAGRRDGKALVGTVVNSTAHDLYFYSEPKAMLQGEVSPPGCYLDAAAILKRQLIAYSIDCWVQSGIGEEALPKKLKTALDAVDRSKEQPQQGHFPFTWLAWTETNRADLLQRFLALFAGELEVTSEQTLKAVLLPTSENSDAVHSTPFAQELLARFQELSAERRRLKNEAAKLQKRYRERCSRPDESLSEQEREDKDSIRREQIAFTELRKQLENRQLLEVLTDEGFLPNYAFPEAGVTLKSVLWRRTNNRSGGRQSEDLPALSYERPANIAIRELVPHGQFYAQGRRVTVDQVDPALNQPEHWRFCPDCSFACKSTDPEFTHSECPRCHTSAFADTGQIHVMAKLSQVQATTEDSASRISDDRDERNPNFFRRELLITPEHNRREITLASTDEGFPFGAEYLAGTTFREINFGENAGVGGHQIAGQQLAVHGFDLCSNCGKVQGNRNPNHNHTWSCRYRDRPANEAPLKHVLFMYREFNSEAVRFLLPGANFWDDSGQPSFVGALHLGLREFFGGKVDHLQAAISTEPQPNSRERKSFLYLFDSVPGGTGYLHQLMENNGQDLRGVLTKAKDTLEACSCSDGCYRCIFMYRQRFQRERTSKLRAIEQLRSILEHWPQLETTSTSLSALKINTQVESDLELQFINKLQEGRALPEDVSVNLKSDLIEGRNGYWLSFTSRHRTVRWKLQLQVELDASRGVDCSSRADFLLTPTAGGKPIAIYTDGWEFHRNRLATDAQQRMALQRSGWFLVWSLTWSDVMGELPSAQKPLQPNALRVGMNPSFNEHPERYLNHWWTDALQQEAELKPRQAQGFSSWQLLMAYLANPNESLWHGMAQQLAMGQSGNPPKPLETLQGELQQVQLLEHTSDWAAQADGSAIGQSQLLTHGLQTVTLLQSQLLASKHPGASFRANHFRRDPQLNEADQKAGWREWLRLGNLFQFLPYALFTTDGWSGADQSTVVNPTALEMQPSDSGSPAQAERSKAWQQLTGLVIDEAQALLLLLKPTWLAEGHPIPIAGFELADARDEVQAVAELAWVEQKIAVTSTADDQAVFEQQQWTCYPLSQSAETTEKKLLNHFANTLVTAA